MFGRLSTNIFEIPCAIKDLVIEPDDGLAAAFVVAIIIGLLAGCVAGSEVSNDVVADSKILLARYVNAFILSRV